jgi:hypothetical protein
MYKIRALYSLNVIHEATLKIITLSSPHCGEINGPLHIWGIRVICKIPQRGGHITMGLSFFENKFY